MTDVTPTPPRRRATPTRECHAEHFSDRPACRHHPNQTKTSARLRECLKPSRPIPSPLSSPVLPVYAIKGRRAALLPELEHSRPTDGSCWAALPHARLVQRAIERRPALLQPRYLGAAPHGSPAARLAGMARRDRANRRRDQEEAAFPAAPSAFDLHFVDEARGNSPSAADAARSLAGDVEMPGAPQAVTGTDVVGALG